jgi:hypothetical protein
MPALCLDMYQRFKGKLTKHKAFITKFDVIRQYNNIP